MVPVMQDAAAEALREGLAKFDGGRGWRDTELSIDVNGDWRDAAARSRALGTGFPDWRKAVVLSKIGRRGADRLHRRLDRDARRVGRGRSPSAASAARPSAICRPGMIIIVKQMGTDSYALRSIPEVGGGFVAEEVRTGRVLAMQGGFDVDRLVATTARPRRCASRARRSSRSSTRPRSKTA